LDLAKIRKKAKAQGSARKPDESAPPDAPPKGAARRKAVGTASAAPAGLPPVEEAELQATPPREPEPQAVAAQAPEPEPAPEPAHPETPSPTPEVAPATGAGEKLLIFDLEREKYAIPIHDIAQIIELPPTTPIPNGPDFLYGILSLRGKIVAVIDVALRLAVRRRAPMEAGKIVVLDMGADQFGLLVDGIDQVVEVNLSGLEPPPEGFRPVAQDFVEGVFHHKGKAVAFLNLPMFLAFEL